MGALDEAMSDYRPIARDDVFVPKRHTFGTTVAELPPTDARYDDEPEHEDPDGDDPFDHDEDDAYTPGYQHGGAGGAGGGAAGGGEATAPEPAPQQDEPDDGEHTDQTEEQVEARARKSEQIASPDVAEQPVEEPPAVLVQDDADEETQEEQVAVPAEPVVVMAPPVTQAAPDATGKTFVPNVRFSFGDDVPNTVLKRFPEPLLQILRQMITPAVGEAFAQKISGQALLTAFFIAKLGADLEVDENTQTAIDGFRGIDPRLTALEDRVEQMNALIAQQMRDTRIDRARAQRTGAIADGLEFAMAYLITDRVVSLPTLDVDESTVDVTQKKVLVARKRIRDRAKEQRTIEEDRARRP